MVDHLGQAIALEGLWDGYGRLGDPDGGDLGHELYTDLFWCERVRVQNVDG